MKSILLLLVAILLGGCAMKAEPAGQGPERRTSVGNGGDDNPFSGNALFLGKKPVRVCMHDSSAVAAKELKTYVQDAFAIWQKYLNEKKVNDASLHPERAGLPEDFQLHLGWQFVECQDNPELEIVIGPTPIDEINFLRERRYPGKVAFLHPYRHFDAKQGRARAYLWIASPVRLDTRYQTSLGRRIWITGHLLHELGHALGCGHVSGTFMSADYYVYLESTQRALSDKEPTAETLKQLEFELWPDQYNELLMCRECSFVTERGWLSASTQIGEIVQYLRPGPDTVEDRYEIDVMRSRAHGPMQLLATAWESDAKTVLDIDSLVEVSRKVFDVPVFKVSWEKDGRTSTIQSFKQAISYEASITPADKLKAPVKFFVRRNTEIGVIELASDDFPPLWALPTRIRPFTPQRLQ